MHRRLFRIRLAALTSAAVMGLALVGSPPAEASGPPTVGGSSAPKVVAKNLDNPRQLSFTSTGALLVAEAGEGGAGPCMAGPEGGEVCFGATGAVTKISKQGHQSRVLTGLPSIGGKDTGAQAIGPSDVRGTKHRITVLIGLGANPAVRATLPAPGKRMGTLIQTTKKKGKYHKIADLAAWEAKHNPVNDPDSNPAGMLYRNGKYLVADAGGNTVLKVNKGGRIKLVAKFKDRQVTAPPPFGQVNVQAVPTSVAVRGHDGALYVSQLTGFPFVKGAAKIYRVNPRTGAKTVYASGLTNVTDLAFKGKTLYAVQLANDGLLSAPPGTEPVGSVVKVKRGGTTPAAHKSISGNLDAPYGIAIKGRYAYVTIHSVVKDAGEVIRIRL